MSTLINRFQDVIVYGNLTQKNLIKTDGTIITTGNTTLLNNLNVGGKVNTSGLICLSSGESSHLAPLGSIAGTYILFNRDGTDGTTYIINSRGSGDTGGIKFQIYNEYGYLMYEPLNIDQLGNIFVDNPMYINSSISLNDHGLYLRGYGDTFHGLKFSSDVDGPHLYGYSGGKLGTIGVDCLTWSNNNVNIMGSLNVNQLTQNGISYDLSLFLKESDITYPVNFRLTDNNWMMSNNFTTTGLKQNYIAYDLSLFALKTEITSNIDLYNITGISYTPTNGAIMRSTTIDNNLTVNGIITSPSVMITSNLNLTIPIIAGCYLPKYLSDTIYPQFNGNNSFTGNNDFTITGLKQNNIAYDLSLFALSSDIIANTNYLTSSNNWSGNNNFNTISCSGLISANGGLTIPSTKNLTIVGNIIAGSTQNLTISSTELGYLDGVNQNIQTQLTNIKNNSIGAQSFTTISCSDTISANGANGITATVINATGLVTASNGLVVTGEASVSSLLSADGGITIASVLNGGLTLVGNIIAGPTQNITITPTELGYLDGLVYNVQQQISVRGAVATAATINAVNATAIVSASSMTYSTINLSAGTWHVVGHFSYNCVTAGTISIETGYLGTSMINSFDYSTNYNVVLPVGAVVNRKLEGFITVVTGANYIVSFNLTIASGTYQKSVSTVNPYYNTLKAYKIF